MSRDRAAQQPPEDRAPLVIGLLGELMLTVRVQGTVEALGYRFRAADSVADLKALLAGPRAAAAVYDLSAAAFPLHDVAAALHGAAGGRPRTIAFFPHVVAELGRDARAANLGTVVPRSRFMSEMAALVRNAVEGGTVKAPAATAASND